MRLAISERRDAGDFIINLDAEDIRRRVRRQGLPVTGRVNWAYLGAEDVGGGNRRSAPANLRSRRRFESHRARAEGADAALARWRRGRLPPPARRAPRPARPLLRPAGAAGRR